MAQKVGKIAKEKKPFDKTYIPLTIAIILLVLFVGGLIFAIVLKPKDKPVLGDTNTLFVEDVKIDFANTCSNDEYKRLADEANKIYAYYEEIADYVFGTYEDANNVDENGAAPVAEKKGYVIQTLLINGNSDLYVMLYDSREEIVEKKDFYDNVIQWIIEDTKYIRQYTVQVYANTETCKDVLVREFTFKTPKWNEASKFVTCQHPLMKDEEVCKHFTFDDKNKAQTFSDFNKKFDEKIKEENKKEQEKQKNKGFVGFIKKYIVYIAIVLVIIIIGIIVFVILKGRKKNEANT